MCEFDCVCVCSTGRGSGINRSILAQYRVETFSMLRRTVSRMTERVQRTHQTQRMFTDAHCNIEDSRKCELCINMFFFFSNSIILFVFRLLLLAFSFVDYSENRLASWAQTANKPHDWTESLINNLLPIRQDFLSGFILLSCVEHAFVSPWLYVCGFVCVCNQPLRGLALEERIIFTQQSVVCSQITLLILIYGSHKIKLYVKDGIK